MSVASGWGRTLWGCGVKSPVKSSGGRPASESRVWPRSTAGLSRKLPAASWAASSFSTAARNSGWPAQAASRKAARSAAGLANASWNRFISLMAALGQVRVPFSEKTNWSRSLKTVHAVRATDSRSRSRQVQEGRLFGATSRRAKAKTKEGVLSPLRASLFFFGRPRNRARFLTTEGRLEVEIAERVVVGVVMVEGVVQHGVRVEPPAIVVDRGVAREPIVVALDRSQHVARVHVAAAPPAWGSTGRFAIGPTNVDTVRST